MMRRFLLLLIVTAWAGALYGSTQLHRYDLALQHNICGPWGCAAKPEALLGYHLFLLALVGPVVVLCVRVAPVDISSRLAFGVAAFGLLGALGLAAWAAGSWVASGQGAEFALQRGLFVVATTPDAPLLPLFLSGLAALFFARRPERTPAATEGSLQQPPASPEATA